jgi:hypothetical protein
MKTQTSSSPENARFSVPLNWNQKWSSLVKWKF